MINCHNVLNARFFLFEVQKETSGGETSWHGGVFGIICCVVAAKYHSREEYFR